MKSMSAFRGSLDLYYQVENSDGSFGPLHPAGNVTNFDITPDAEELEVISTANATYGQSADSMVDAKPTTFSFTVNRFDIDSWAMAFMGEIGARSAVSGNVVDEEHTVSMGDLIKLAGLDVSAVVVKDSTGSTTYDLTDDYLVTDAELGIIQVVDGGAITDASVLHVSYTTAAETGWLLSGGTKSSKFIKLFGRGVNRFNNKRSIVTIPRGSIKPGGNFSLVGTDAASIQFDGTINVPTDASAPFTIIAEA